MKYMFTAAKKIQYNRYYARYRNHTFKLNINNNNSNNHKDNNSPNNHKSQQSGQSSIHSDNQEEEQLELQQHNRGVSEFEPNTDIQLR